MACDKKFIVIFMCMSLFFCLRVELQAETIRRKPTTITGKQFLPLRVLSRPFSNIYNKADETSAIIQENVPAFSLYVVYTRPVISSSSTGGTGWYEVGSDTRGNILGWMKVTDVMEWKQAMCLSFSQSLDRKPVLMFNDIIPLLKLINLPSEERKTQALEYYKQIQNKRISSGFPVIAMEPRGANDITKQFYFMPILEAVEIEFEGRETRLIKLTSALSGIREESTLLALDEPQKTEAANEVLTREPITAWVIDRDLFDPSIPSLEVRVLLSKKNLSSLRKTLSEILTAGSHAQISGDDFFNALLAVTCLSIRMPKWVRNAKELAATGLLPECMEGLPYDSKIMDMNNDLWSLMSIDQQEEFLNGLDVKLQRYANILDKLDGWVSLIPGADDGDMVYPLPLELLP